MPNEKNPAIPIWFVIHNVAMWSGGLLWAAGRHGWAIGLTVVGLWSLVWVVGLMFGPGGTGEVSNLDIDKGAEIDHLARGLASWVRRQTTVHDVSMPFALARILVEVVYHDEGDVDDCIALVGAAADKVRATEGTD